MVTHYEEELARVEYEYAYLCSQEYYITGVHDGGAYSWKTLYVSCDDENNGGRNFIRLPHVEKKYLKSSESGATQSPSAIERKDLTI